MHAARLSSPRLQRVLRFLSDGKPHSTRAIVRGAHVVAVNSCVAELRQHGANIIRTTSFVRGQRRFFYRMTKEPEGR